MRRPASRRDVHRGSPAAAKRPDIPFPDDRSRGYRVRHQKKASSIPRMERICIQWPGDRVSGWLWRALWADVCSGTKGGRSRSGDDKASHQWTSTKIDGPSHWIPQRPGPIAARQTGSDLKRNFVDSVRGAICRTSQTMRARIASNLADLACMSVSTCARSFAALQFRNSARCMVHRVVCEVIAQASYESD